ncbi:hypothetical protein UFOVP232_52 [uncultured Caudovirales phage]|uniref:Uncharacterized protein n=1 Tax=uncultured Caudovirales phage TaxID=2100421 RepID=A0A6J7WVG8_9CAUD|nr:hypothetical protein UFOVP232_52 [uncultured Caudovirales phage]
MINLLNHNPHPPRPRLSAEEYELRIWGFVVVIVMLVFAGITASMLYSVIFVTQPIKSMAPIDQAFTKMLNDIVLLIVGGIGGIMAKKGVHTAAERMANPTPPSTGSLSPQPATLVTSPTPVQVPVQQGFNWMGFQNPALDETWTPPPPPTTPADHQEADHDREHMAAARKEAE